MKINQCFILYYYYFKSSSLQWRHIKVYIVPWFLVTMSKIVLIYTKKKQNKTKPKNLSYVHESSVMEQEWCRRWGRGTVRQGRGLWGGNRGRVLGGEAHVEPASRKWSSWNWRSDCEKLLREGDRCSVSGWEALLKTISGAYFIQIWNESR